MTATYVTISPDDDVLAEVLDAAAVETSYHFPGVLDSNVAYRLLARAHEHELWYGTLADGEGVSVTARPFFMAKDGSLGPETVQVELSVGNLTIQLDGALMPQGKVTTRRKAVEKLAEYLTDAINEHLTEAHALVERLTGVEDPARDSRAKYPQAHAQLSSSNGNAFAIIAEVAQALERAGAPADVRRQWRAEALTVDSYDALLQLAMDWVRVS